MKATFTRQTLSSTLIVLYLFLAGFFWYYWYPISHTRDLSLPKDYTNQLNSPEKFDPSDESIDLPSSSSILDFWQDMAVALEKARPNASVIDPGDEHVSHNYTNFEWVNAKETPRLEQYNISDVDERELRAAHRIMQEEARMIATRLPYQKGSRGIVMTASKKLLPMVLVSIRMVRRSHTSLPIQVWLDSTDDYNKMVCDELLPQFEASCRFVGDVYSAANVAAPLHRYAYKIFAMLFSSFEHVIFVDADAFPIHDIEPLFHSAPYTSHGLVLWPDYWAITSSAHFYHIAGIPEVPITSRRSTESGIVMLDKGKHAATLMMVAYYNYYGPEYYYALLSQHAAGAGDKETFIPAALVMDMPFYQVKSGVQTAGYWRDDKFHGAAILQHDPQVDFKAVKAHFSHLDANMKEYSSAKKLLFVHQNGLKLDVANMFKKGERMMGEDKTKWQRPWGEKLVKEFGRDVERELYESVQLEACRMSEELCGKATQFFNHVFNRSGGDFGEI
ncbi:nucleotide-diphospho-sugar transferase [Polyplosphaeria fusca]|uniref:Nucleotide-diphospho-sugar transferase n=1 Tax=Polyplosphaeria fusca TaxID=682080 RepID=A0A9P4R5L3_9PLEO|nr:nucleotide-diphospho-sugar transferase [Polyplosphaeria fusca]